MGKFTKDELLKILGKGLSREQLLKIAAEHGLLGIPERTARAKKVEQTLKREARRIERPTISKPAQLGELKSTEQVLKETLREQRGGRSKAEYTHYLRREKIQKKLKFLKMEEKALEARFKEIDKNIDKFHGKDEKRFRYWLGKKYKNMKDQIKVGQKIMREEERLKKNIKGTKSTWGKWGDFKKWRKEQEKKNKKFEEEREEELDKIDEEEDEVLDDALRYEGFTPEEMDAEEKADALDAMEDKYDGSTSSGWDRETVTYLCDLFGVSHANTGCIADAIRARRGTKKPSIKVKKE